MGYQVRRRLRSRSVTALDRSTEVTDSYRQLISKKIYLKMKSALSKIDLGSQLNSKNCEIVFSPNIVFVKQVLLLSVRFLKGQRLQVIQGYTNND